MKTTKRKIRWDRVVDICLFIWVVYGLVSIFKANAELPEPIEAPKVEVNVVSDYDLSNFVVSGIEVEGEPLVSLGIFKITFYADCPQDQGKWVGKTSTGAKPTVGRTIAVDPKVIPYGTIVWVDADNDGVLERYVAEDCGGAIKQQHIDVLVSTYEEGCKRGVIYKEVYIER